MKSRIQFQKEKTAAGLPKNYSSYELTKNEAFRFLLLCGSGLMAAGFLFYQSLILSLFLSCLAYPALRPYRAYLAEKRRQEMKEQFRDVLYSVSASIAAGRQMPEALHEAGQNMKLIYREDSLMGMELHAMVKRLREYREPEEVILKEFAARTCIEDISDFVDIYLTCRQTGGDLVRVLTKTSEIILDKMAIQKEIRTITSQKRFEAKILTAIPFLIILLLRLISPEYLAPMYEGLTGRLIMTAALFGIGAAYFWSMRLTKIEV